MGNVICNSIGTTNLCNGCGASVPHYHFSCEPCPINKTAKCVTREEYMGKANFFLNKDRMSIPTNNTMYDCEACVENGKEHRITDKTTPFGWMRICTGCGVMDGPWSLYGDD